MHSPKYESSGAPKACNSLSGARTCGHHKCIIIPRRPKNILHALRRAQKYMHGVYSVTYSFSRLRHPHRCGGVGTDMAECTWAYAHKSAVQGGGNMPTGAGMFDIKNSDLRAVARKKHYLIINMPAPAGICQRNNAMRAQLRAPSLPG